MYVCMYVFLRICIYVYVLMYICTHVYVYTCVCIWTQKNTNARTSARQHTHRTTPHGQSEAHLPPLRLPFPLSTSSAPRRPTYQSSPDASMLPPLRRPLPFLVAQTTRRQHRRHSRARFLAAGSCRRD